MAILWKEILKNYYDTTFKLNYIELTNLPLIIHGEAEMMQGVEEGTDESQAQHAAQDHSLTVGSEAVELRVAVRDHVGQAGEDDVLHRHQGNEAYVQL